MYKKIAFRSMVILCLMAFYTIIFCVGSIGFLFLFVVAIVSYIDMVMSTSKSLTIRYNLRDMSDLIEKGNGVLRN